MSIWESSRTGSHRLVTMRDLNQRTSEVMGEIVDEGSITLVTRYGRPVALIMPLPANAESYMLKKLVEGTIPEVDAEGTMGLDEIAKHLGLDAEHVRLRAEVAEP